jgi:pilus assembly protein CpaB
MRTGTVVSLGASAVLGLGALIVARVWLPQGHAPQPKASAPVSTVPVVVATSAIAYGGKLDAAHLTIEQLPVGDAPQGSFRTTNQILQQPGGPPIALTPIAAREPVLASKLSGGGARPTVSAVIDEGFRAFTIQVSDVAGVGGHVLPGDRVDVILTREIPWITLNGPKPCDCKRERADVLLQNVKILGVDLNADPTTVQAAVAHTATLEVNVQDAQKLSVAATIGSMSLALRRTGQADVTPVRTVEIRDLQWNGARAPGPAPLPDYFRIPVAHSPAPGAIAPHGALRTHSVVVVHGDTSTTVDVPAERLGAGA